MDPASPPESPDSGGAANPRHVSAAEERAGYERTRRHAAVRHRRPALVLGVALAVLPARLVPAIAMAAAGPGDRAADRAGS